MAATSAAAPTRCARQLRGEHHVSRPPAPHGQLVAQALGRPAPDAHRAPVHSAQVVRRAQGRQVLGLVADLDTRGVGGGAGPLPAVVGQRREASENKPFCFRLGVREADRSDAVATPTHRKVSATGGTRVGSHHPKSDQRRSGGPTVRRPYLMLRTQAEVPAGVFAPPSSRRAAPRAPHGPSPPGEAGRG